MLKALIRKQLMEMFGPYFVNRKTGKARSRNAVIGAFAGFGVLMLMLCGLFFGLAAPMVKPMFGMGLDWLFFSFMAIVSVLLGVFGSVFNTYAGLYMAKDNDLLISMPIPARTILTSRMVSVEILSLMYSAVVWFPACAASWVMGGVSFSAVVCQLLAMVLISLFVSVITCALGWVVSLIASRLKNKSFLVMILTVAFIGAYYSMCFRLDTLMENVMQNVASLSVIVEKYLGLFAVIGRAGTGDFTSLAIFAGITLVLCALCIWIMAKTFVALATQKTGSAKVKYTEKSIRQSKAKTALLKRELKRFTASAGYMMNCGMGMLVMLVMAVLALIKRTELTEYIAPFLQDIPGAVEMVPLIVAAVVCAVAGLNMVTTPSVSLEGKTLWILKSLPVSPWDVLRAKTNLHVMLNIWPGMVLTLVLGFCLKLEPAMIVIALCFVWMYIWLTAQLGLIIGLRNPIFHWTNEMVVIKQGMNVFMVMLIDFVLALVFPALYLLIGPTNMDPRLFMGIAVVLMALAVVFQRHYLRTAGTKQFEAL
ncbi:MAG: hypothetical protein Q4C54_05205 [Clostridia bacterium]|nr:hypothetical protein [Clostridia bacterium]